MGACAMDVNNHKKDAIANNVENAFAQGGGDTASSINALDLLKEGTKSICPEVNGVNTMGYIGQKLSEGAKAALTPSVPELSLYDSAKPSKS